MMMWRSSVVIGYSIRAADGSIGSISDLLFDDEHWGLRWAVVDTGTWLPGRKVLLPPSALGRPDPVNGEFPVDLSRDRIENAPGVESDAPVSRQIERALYDYYDWSPYWSGGYGYPLVAGAPIPPAGVGYPGPVPRERSRSEPKGDPHLRSVSEITGYYVEASDGNIGHIEEFLIEDEVWAVRYLVVDTKNWWPGKMVLISPQWLREISWADRQVFLEVGRDQVRNSPEYDPTAALDRRYEERLYRHYGYPTYWAGRV